MNNDEDSGHRSFVTRDWILVSSLSLLGFCIEATEKDQDGRVAFYIQRSEELEAAIQSFWMRRMRVEPQEFSRHMKFVKARMYDGN
ncbi:MAG: DUF5659 domain-containing protein [Patescibacteria group bacterium]